MRLASRFGLKGAVRKCPPPAARPRPLTVVKRRFDDALSVSDHITLVWFKFSIIVDGEGGDCQREPKTPRKFSPQAPVYDTLERCRKARKEGCRKPVLGVWLGM